MARTPSMATLRPEHRADSFWRRLSQPERVAFADAGTARPYARGATLIRADETDPWVAVLYTGRVRVLAADNMRVIARRWDGDIVGEQALLDGRPRSATVRAETRVRALVLGAVELDRVLTRFPRVLRVLCAVLSERLREADRRFDGHDRLAFAKVVDFLLRHADERVPVVHIGSQAALGQSLGVSRDSVVRALRGLRAAGVVTTSRGLVTVRDLRRLRATG
ncbi:Crp/Fnr family transcriptional regulator [Actinophytocola gossypii]|uniref:Crp/Fnr family transcriptional regulator n=1 Tax=Actinophytocola gossypii TaxID=2812003 RepID=A0ABT2J0Z8_9PSEU|nr:Crp/Fnr family transcriptional regulator [Actinophytocola gossypii]MCT2581533.1 Crp/Fnr family transcriptional regulator [Actinophytocola gossypii]